MSLPSTIVLWCVAIISACIACRAVVLLAETTYGSWIEVKKVYAWRATHKHDTKTPPPIVEEYEIDEDYQFPPLDEGE